MSEKVSVKKVKAYPIPVIFQIGGAGVRGQVMKLAPQGFLAEIALNTLKPGDRFGCSFELPVMHVTIVCEGVLVKLYNQWKGSGTPQAPSSENGAAAPNNAGATAAPLEGDLSSKVLHLIEFQFQNLSSEHKSKIHTFLAQLAKSGG